MGKIEQTMTQAREADQDQASQNARSITMYATANDAEQHLDKPIEVFVKQGQDDGGQRVFAERAPFEQLNRHSTQASKAELLGQPLFSGFDEEEEPIEIDIAQLSQQVYRHIRTRLMHDRERLRRR